MKRASVLAALLFAATVARTAGASPPDDDATPSSWAASRSLLDHFGIDAARRLVHTEEGAGATAEPALQGIDRAAAIGDQDTVALLVHLLGDARGAPRSDARVLLAATRSLAPFASQHAVAHALEAAALNASATRPAGRGVGETARPFVADSDRHARIELARETAALALARAHDASATDILVVAARGGASGQVAARTALALSPPVVISGPVIVTRAALSLFAALGDLRAGDWMIESSESLDVALRAAALRGLGALGETRGVKAAEAGAHDADAGVRIAATEALIDLGAPGAATAVRHLIEDDVTVGRGIELSARVNDDDVTGALASRVRVSSRSSERRAAVVALGRQGSARAQLALAELLADPVLAGDAAEALARSNGKVAWDLIAKALSNPPSRRMGARMAALRGRLEGATPKGVMREVQRLARAADGEDRSVGVAALVLLGEATLTDALADPDARVRRAAAMACEPLEPSCAAALARALARETDPVTRLVLMRSLADDGNADVSPAVSLVEAMRGGGPDAPLAILAFARTSDEGDRDTVLAALASSDPVVRAHVARGLGASASAWAVGRLADAYETEVDARVRRAIIVALASRTEDERVPARARALDRAARLDPEAAIRAIAERALRGLAVPRATDRPDAVWLRVTDGSGRPPAWTARGTLVRADGLALPVVFDDDGYALTAAPRGPARLLLAPRPRAYDADPHDP